MAVITTTDPVFGTVAQKTNPGFMADVVRLINESPNLVAEINALDGTRAANNAQATINLQSASGQGGSTSYHSPQINISTLVSYDDGTKPYVGGSLTASYDRATPAAVFVGTLAHEIGHWLDANLAPIYTQGLLSHYSIEQAVATEFSSEGKAAYSQYVSKLQIDAANGAAGVGYFHATNTTRQDTGELSQLSHMSDVGQAESYLGSQFWNVGVNGGTYLSTMWNGYSSAVNYLGIDYTTITDVTVQLNDAGILVGSTLQTANLDYSFAYGAIGHETASVLNSAGSLLYTEVFVDDGSSSYTLTRYQSGGTFAQGANANETVAGGGNNVTGTGNALLLQGNNNMLTGVSAAASDGIEGNGNVFFDHSAARAVLQLALSGNANDVILGAASTTITGSATGNTVFGGSGALRYDGNGGTLVLGGAATVSGSGAHTVLFGGNGSVVYDGKTGYDDVIMGAGSATIQAGAGGGWYEGGTDGHNFIKGSDSGLGTVLAAGGNGDTVTGGAHGGDYFLAGAGNETLNGGNSVGTQTMFLGSGSAVVTTGSANSIIDTGTGSALINDFGHTVVYGGTGRPDTYTASAGHMDVVGFRVGTDHVSGTVASAAFQGSNTILQLSNGASITLVSLQTQAFA